MNYYEVSGELTKTMRATDERRAARKFYRQTGARPTHVGDKTVIGLCELDDAVILEGDEFRHDGEGVPFCMPCFGDGTDIAVPDDVEDEA
jgi:hypothetical protein